MLQMKEFSGYRVLNVIAVLSIARNGCFRMIEDISESLAALAGQHAYVFVTASFCL